MGRHREFDIDQALDAALSVFWQKGYEGASFEDLTRATGVARPGLYAAFGNKESLFLRALDRYDAKYMTYMSAALEEPGIRDVVQRILDGSVEVQTLYPESRGCMGVNGAIACSEDSEPIRKELVARRKASELALRHRLERAKREGELAPSTDCTVLAALVMTVTHGMAVQAKAGASKSILTAVARQFMATWPSTACLKGKRSSK